MKWKKQKQNKNPNTKKNQAESGLWKAVERGDMRWALCAVRLGKGWVWQKSLRPSWWFLGPTFLGLHTPQWTPSQILQWFNRKEVRGTCDPRDAYLGYGLSCVCLPIGCEVLTASACDVALLRNRLFAHHRIKMRSVEWALIHWHCVLIKTGNWDTATDVHWANDVKTKGGSRKVAGARIRLSPATSVGTCLRPDLGLWPPELADSISGFKHPGLGWFLTASPRKPAHVPFLSLFPSAVAERNAKPCPIHGQCVGIMLLSPSPPLPGFCSPTLACFTGSPRSRLCREPCHHSRTKPRNRLKSGTSVKWGWPHGAWTVMLWPARRRQYCSDLPVNGGGLACFSHPSFLVFPTGIYFYHLKYTIQVQISLG